MSEQPVDAEAVIAALRRALDEANYRLALTRALLDQQRGTADDTE